MTETITNLMFDSLKNTMNLSANNTLAILESLFDESTTEKSLSPISFKDDPIALSHASYQHWLSNPGTRWLDLDAVTASNEDRETAKKIRDYYRGRITWGQLKYGGNLSDFRATLGKLVCGEMAITKKELGMIYRLPYFYAEDCALDRVIEQTSDDVTKSNLGRTLGPSTGTYQLVERIFKSRRARESVDFWLKSDICNAPCLISVDHQNPLLPMLTGVLSRDRIRLQSYMFPKQHRGYHRERAYYQLGNAEVIFDY